MSAFPAENRRVGFFHQADDIYQGLNRRLPVYLMRVTSSYLEDRTLMVETDDGTKEIEITASRSRISRWPYYMEYTLRRVAAAHTIERYGFSRIRG